jgi:hypothetical protein
MVRALSYTSGIVYAFFLPAQLSSKLAGQVLPQGCVRGAGHGDVGLRGARRRDMGCVVGWFGRWFM